MTTPKISVIVPIYNAEKYIENCIESILDQDFKNIELILVNDGSTDNSKQICDEFARKDSRVKVLDKINAGAAAARKYGVQNASGEWIFFSDSDDTLPPKALSNLIEFADKNDNCVDIISGTFANKQYIYKHDVFGILSPTEYICSILKGETNSGPWAKLIRRSLFSKFKWETSHEIFINEDMLMLVGLSHYAKKICVNNNSICYNFIPRPNSTSSRKMPLEGWEKLFKEIETFLDSGSSDIRHSFYSYRINALYMNLVLRGTFIDIKTNAYVYNLIQSQQRESLTKQEQKTTKILSSICLQKLYYKLSCIKKTFTLPLYKLASKCKNLIKS